MVVRGRRHYVFPVKPGRIIFEMEGIKEELAKEALEIAADKLPIKTKFILKNIKIAISCDNLDFL